jgi:hypothetical protein
VENCSSLLAQLKDILKDKVAAEIHRVVFFLHENAPAHRVLATQKKLACLCFQYLDHPHSSPDLSPSDYHLFLELKRQLKFRYFSSDAEVISVADTWLDGQTYDFS